MKRSILGVGGRHVGMLRGGGDASGEERREARDGGEVL